jgi:hypothetical protein
MKSETLRKRVVDGRYSVRVSYPAPGSVPDADAARLASEVAAALEEMAAVFRSVAGGAN